MMMQHGCNYYVAHPKTASLATVDALKTSEWREIGGHHGIYPHPPDSKIISVVRDPADWLVSWYHYLGKKTSFQEFLRTFSNPLQIGTLHFFAFPFSTHVIFFDNLQEGWNAVLDDLRRPRITLGHKNVSLGRESVDKYYDSQTFELFLSRWGDLYHWYQNIRSLKGDYPYLCRT